MSHEDFGPRDASDEDRRAYREALRVLRAASPLARATCPSPRALVQEALSPERVAARDRHVRACPACREDLRDLAALEARPAASSAEPSLAEAVRDRLVLALDRAAGALRLIESTLAPAPPPALAVARGAGGEAGLAGRAPFGAGELELQAVAGAEGLDLLARALSGAPSPFRLVLLGEGGPVEGRSSDAAGVVRLGGVEPGAYVLEAYAPQASEPALRLDLELRSPE